MEDEELFVDAPFSVKLFALAVLVEQLAATRGFGEESYTIPNLRILIYYCLLSLKSKFSTCVIIVFLIILN